MSLMSAIILGAIQGITEFLPISSSAHLILLPWFFKIEEVGIDKLAFDVALHFGTLLAILSIYGRRFFDLVKEGLSDIKGLRFKDSLFLKICIATIPAALFGLFCKDIIEGHLRTPYVAAASLAIVAILMVVSERLYTPGRGITFFVAILVGIAQAVALIPGVSRSGITITAGIFLGLRREEAVDFSFLLSIPIILGTFLYEFKDLKGLESNLSVYIGGVLSAFVFGVLSLGFLIRFLKRYSLDIFALYRLLLALFIIILSNY